MDAKEIRNMRVVQEFIGAFGVGDMARAMSLLADDVIWESPVSRNPPPELVWAKPRKGPQEVMQFIQDMWNTVQPYVMDTHGVTAQGDRVIIEGRNQCQVRATGKFYDHEWVLVFEVKDGKITSHRQFYDASAILPAFHG